MIKYDINLPYTYSLEIWFHLGQSCFKISIKWAWRRNRNFTTHQNVERFWNLWTGDIATPFYYFALGWKHKTQLRCLFQGKMYNHAPSDFWKNIYMFKPKEHFVRWLLISMILYRPRVDRKHIAIVWAMMNLPLSITKDSLHHILDQEKSTSELSCQSPQIITLSQE